jgi:hypothetical protein
LASSNPLSTRHQRFACARLSQSYLPESRSDFSATFTTIAFDDSSLAVRHAYYPPHRLRIPHKTATHFWQ